MFLKTKLPHKLPMSAAEKGLVYNPANPRLEQKDMERVFARLFSTEDGQKALAYLQMLTFQRAAAPTAGEDQLRYMEGQRSMVATILRLIDRGRNG